MGLVGFAIILAFLVLGEVVAALTGNFLPGSVTGMVLLFLALRFKLVRPDWIRQAADLLTRNMTLLFLPPAIGIVDQWAMLSSHIWLWAALVAGCWLLVLSSAGLTHKAVSSLLHKKKEA
ncbi:MAG: CidA/LrgA family protein [Bacteroidales bacterium]|nr:CidA/LrgA family protein [Bacteroidales bacterium]